MKQRHLTSRGIALLAILVSQLTHAATLTWDANGATSGQTNGGGEWLNPNLWWNSTSNQDWVSGSDAIFGGPSGAGGAVTLASSTTVGAITFNIFTGTYTLGTPGVTLTIDGGITNNSMAGALAIASPIILGGAQAWGGSSTGALAVSGGINNNGHTLTLGVNGNISMNGTANIISGGGGLTKSGSGNLILGANPAPTHTYSGPTTINGGVVMIAGKKTAGNMTLNGGMLTDYYQATTSFTGGLGTGNNQIQIYGEGGFGGGNGTSAWRIGASGSVLTWGASGENGNINATGYFNPTSLKFLTSADNMGTSIYGQASLDNGIDLNGAARTVQVLAASGTNAISNSWGRISGVISGSTGSLIKTGGGNLVLSGANTYGGGTTINQGSVRFTSLSSMPNAGNVTINTGATLAVEAGGTGDWTNGASGVGTLGGLFSGLGSAGTSTVSFVGDATLRLEMTGNLAYSGNIPNLGDNLSIIKTGGSALTLSGSNNYSGTTWAHAGTLSFNSIANVGGGNSALGAPATVAKGTISIGSDGNTVTLAYTGSGHGSDRVIRLAAASGTSVLDASGTGPLALTSSLTAAVGAKSLTFTGSNTAANTLGATSIPGLAEVLTITKSGAGTWQINGFTSPKNAWTVSAGTLLAAGNITTGDQNFTVSGGTLTGVGPIVLQSSKTLTVQTAGSLSPGNSGVGTMAVTGILNISAMASGTGKLNFEMSAPAASDQIAVTGTAQIGTGVLGLNDFVFIDLGGMTSSTYVLISTTGGITGTLDPTNRSGTIGSITGILQINGNNLEFTTDQDGDGLPDSYELANTTPPSATALDPIADLENGGTGDGLTNLQEYLLGTDPNNPDTDTDGLLDGVETNTGTWVSASNTGTNPLVLDSDGDTLRDGYETNTGIFSSAANTGTDPNKVDTDVDGLRDNVETNTGSYVSTTDTGTSPVNANTDGDNAGDWYEVAIIDKKPSLGSPPNSPNDANLKPNIPYPMPAPDSSTGVTNKPVKVYIMSGQSNMVGYGTVNGSGPGTLQTMTGTEKKFPNLVASGGGWTTRQDVKYRGLISDFGDGPLKPDVAGTSYGPELGFGYVMGWHHDEPVLLIKASIGNRGLMWDYLPPASPRTVYGVTTYPAYGESPETWGTSGGAPSPGIWYAGKQYDDCFLAENDMGASPWALSMNYQASGNLGSQVLHNGAHYLCKLSHASNAAAEPGIGANWATYWKLYDVAAQWPGDSKGRGSAVDVLDNFAADYPAWASQGFEIAGFVWWQGYDDTGEPRATRYEPNMVQFIKQIRLYYENRYNNDASAMTKTKPNAPFVLATLATNGGWGNPDPGHAKVAQAQLNVDGNAKKANGDPNYPEFAGNVKTMEARGFWRDAAISPSGQGYHYNWNAETYLLTGDALGRAMIELQSVTPPGSTYADWIAGYPSVPPGLAGFDQDADGDGIDNGAENFFGTNPGVGSSGLVAGASSGSTFTFTHPQNVNPATGVSAAYRWSKDLETFRSHGETDGAGTKVNFNAVTNAGITTVTATVTGAAAAKLFVDLKVIQN